MTSFNKKKEEALAHLDIDARETALNQLGTEDRFEFADQAKIYNAEHGKSQSAPIEMVDASVPTGHITPPYFQRVRADIFRDCAPKDWRKLARKTMACGFGARRRSSPPP